MPICTIKTLPLGEQIEVAGILKQLGNKLSIDLGIDLSKLVVKWEYIPADHFLFNGEVTGKQEKSTHHPFVYFSATRKWSEQVKHKKVTTLVECLSDGLAIEPDNICIIFNSIAPGELFVSGNFIGAAE